jgi:hypothetical protein
MHQLLDQPVQIQAKQQLFLCLVLLKVNPEIFIDNIATHNAGLLHCPTIYLSIVSSLHFKKFSLYSGSIKLFSS